MCSTPPRVGADVRVHLSVEPSKLTDVPRRQLATLERLGVPIRTSGGRIPDLESAELIIDALIGYSLRGAPRGEAADLILQANAAHVPILALDVRSGVDAGAGAVHGPAIRARATMTRALPKQGLRGAAARKHVGELYLADIGVPPELYERPPLDLTAGLIFASESVIRLW